MESTSRKLPSLIRSYIAVQAEIGTKYNNIVSKMQKNYDRTISKGTISKIAAKFEGTKSIADKPRSDRPHLFTDEQEDAIIEAVEDDRKISAVDVAMDIELNEVGTSLSTIKNVLAANGLNAVPLLRISLVLPWLNA